MDLCRRTALIDEESDHDHVILFNSNTFRDGKYATKALRVIDGLSASDQQNLSEVRQMLSSSGALYERDVVNILGRDLYRRIVSVGIFDRLEVSNRTESVGYITSPNDFQKFGRPFEDDPIDDAYVAPRLLQNRLRRSDRFRRQWPTARMLYTPIHASWLNQVEVYFSIISARCSRPTIPRPRPAGTSPPRVRALLRGDRPSLQVEVHARRPPQCPATHPDNRVSAPRRGMARYVTEFPGYSTKLS